MKLQKKCAAVVAALATGGLVGATSASATIFDCTKPLTHNLTLTSNSGCPGFGAPGGLVIGADHITINLNGFSMGDTFGEVLSSNGHRFDTIENGSLITQYIPLVLNNVQFFTIRNVQAQGDETGIVLTGGSHNRVVNSIAAKRFGGVALQLVRERDDLLRYDKTLGSPSGCNLTLDQTAGIRLTDNVFGHVAFNGSNRNILTRNQLNAPCSPPYSLPTPGVTGTGNFNVLRRNTIFGGVSLIGFGNVLLHNVFQP
jgi:hypothetical protein